MRPHLLRPPQNLCVALQTVIVRAPGPRQEHGGPARARRGPAALRLAAPAGTQPPGQCGNLLQGYLLPRSHLPVRDAPSNASACAQRPAPSTTSPPALLPRRWMKQVARTQLWPSLGAKFSPAGTDELVRRRELGGLRRSPLAGKAPRRRAPAPSCWHQHHSPPAGAEIRRPCSPRPAAARCPPLPPTSPARSPAPLLPGRLTTTRRAWGAACAGWRRCPAPRRWPWQCATRCGTSAGSPQQAWRPSQQRFAWLQPHQLYCSPALRPAAAHSCLCLCLSAAGGALLRALPPLP